MRSNARKIGFGLGLALLIIGCGGSTTLNLNQPSIYRGTWNGSWISASSGDRGTISTLVINADGSFAGTMGRISDGKIGQLAGTVRPDGAYTATVNFGSGNFVLLGTMLLSSGRLTSAFSYRSFGQDYGATFDLSSTSSTTTGGSSSGSTAGGSAGGTAGGTVGV